MQCLVCLWDQVLSKQSAQSPRKHTETVCFSSFHVRTDTGTQTLLQAMHWSNISRHPPARWLNSKLPVWVATCQRMITFHCVCMCCITLLFRKKKKQCYRWPCLVSTFRNPLSFLWPLRPSLPSCLIHTGCLHGSFVWTEQKENAMKATRAKCFHFVIKCSWQCSPQEAELFLVEWLTRQFKDLGRAVRLCQIWFLCLCKPHRTPRIKSVYTVQPFDKP